MPDNAPINGDVSLPADRRDRAGDWVAALPLAARDAGVPGGYADAAPVEPSPPPGNAQPLAVFENADGGAAIGADATEIAPPGRASDWTQGIPERAGTFAPDSSRPPAPWTGTAVFSSSGISNVSSAPASAAAPASALTSAPALASAMDETQAALSTDSSVAIMEPVSVLSANFPSQALSANQLTELDQELSSVLATLQGLLTSKVFQESLPLLGKVLGTSAASSVRTAIDAFHAFETALLSAVQSLPAGSMSQDLADALNAVAAAHGFGGTIGASVDASNALVVDFNNSGTFSAGTVTLDSGFGLPGLGFAVPSASAVVSLGYTLNERVTIPQVGVATADSVSGPELAVNLNVGTPSFGVDVDLGFLQYAATDAGSSLQGTFAVSSSGSVGFQGAANLAINLQTDLGSAKFPSMSAELAGTWQFGNAAAGTSANVDPANPFTFGDTPAIELKDVTLNIGSFLKQFLLPIYNNIMAIIAPFQPVIDLFNNDNLIPFLSQFLKDAPDVVQALDKAGLLSSSNPLGYTGDKKVTLLDLMALEKDNPPGTENPTFQPFVKAISAINSFEQLGTIIGLAGPGLF